MTNDKSSTGPERSAAKATVKDIAAAAGVSPATVSNALNNRRGVSDEIRQRIMKTARELGYGREAAPGRTVIRFVIFKRHGHVVADTPFFASLIEGMERQCRALGAELTISHVGLTDPDLQEVVASFGREYTGGIILLATEMQEEDTALFQNLHLPIVMLDNAFRSIRNDAVLIGNADAAWQAVSALADLGHAEIGHLMSAVPIRNFQERARGYSEALAARGLREEPDFRFRLEPTAEGAFRDMKQTLAGTNVRLPTAFFADNDLIAFGAVKALQEQGFRIPEDISVIGFDDMPFCEMIAPRLSTVRVFKQEMGALAVARLFQVMNGGGVSTLKTEVDTELVLRDSCRERK